MILRRALAAAAVTTLSFVALAGCSDSDSGGATDTDSDTSTEVGEAVTVVSTPDAPVTTETTATTEPQTATTVVAPAGAPTGEDAALTLYDAWTKDDRVGAATVAEPAAIDVMWTATPGPYELYRGCDDGEFDTGGCLFRDRSTNNTIQINLEKRDDMWIVVGTFFSEG